VKELELPGDALAGDDRYVVNLKGSKLQVRDRRGKLVFEPNREFRPLSVERPVQLVGNRIYIVEGSPKDDSTFERVWIGDLAKKRLSPLDELNRLVRKVPPPELCFSSKYAAIADEKKLVIYDLALRRVSHVLPRKCWFEPIGWTSDTKIAGIGCVKLRGRKVTAPNVGVLDIKSGRFEWCTDFDPDVGLGHAIAGQGHVLAEYSEPSNDHDRQCIVELRSRKVSFLDGMAEFTPLFLDSSGILHSELLGYFGLWKMRLWGKGPLGPAVPSERPVQGRVRQKWAVELTHDLETDPYVGPDGTVYVVTERECIALRSDGSKKWRLRKSDLQFCSVVATKETVYLAMSDRLRALARDGTRLWQWIEGIEVWGPAFGHDGTLLFGDGHGHLHALSEGGKEKWRRTLARGENAAVSAPVVGEDGIVYALSSSGALHAFEPGGRSKWVFRTQGQQAGDPILVPGLGVAFIVEEFDGGSSSALFVVDGNGRQRWKKMLPAEAPDRVSASKDGTVYYGDGRALHAVNERGHEEWKFHAPGCSPPLVVGRNGTVYVASDDGNIYAIGRDGKREWAFNTMSDGARVGGVGRDGTVYGRTWDTVFALHVKR